MTRSPRLPRKAYTAPPKGSWRSLCCTSAASPSKPLRMSVTPAARYTRTPVGGPIKRTRPGRPPPPHPVRAAPAAAPWARLPSRPARTPRRATAMPRSQPVAQQRASPAVHQRRAHPVSPRHVQHARARHHRLRHDPCLVIVAEPSPRLSPNHLDNSRCHDVAPVPATVPHLWLAHHLACKAGKTGRLRLS